MNCAEVQDRIVHRREGWLSRDEAASVDSHLAECENCRRAYEADGQLRAALERLPEREVPAPSWRQVVAARGPSRPSAPRWLLIPALGAAAASAALLWITMFVPRATAPSGVNVAADSLSDAARQTHMLLAASDLGSDPNRAIVAWRSTGGEH